MTWKKKSKILKVLIQTLYIHDLHNKREKVYIKNQQHKMNFYLIKCSKFTNDNDIKIKHEINGKNNLYFSILY